MKIKNVLLSLSLAGMCFSQASAQNVPHPSSASPAARHIGDGVRSIGDTNRYVSNSVDERPSEFLPQGEFARSAVFSSDLDANIVAPTACASASCGSGCEQSFGSCRTSPNNRWFGAEALLWFSQNHRTPPLVTTAPAGTLPVAGAAGVATEFGGGDGIDHGVLPGYRVSGGMYFGDCQKFGIGGRGYGIFSDSEESTTASNGTSNLGLPFFNVNPASLVEDAFLVASSVGPNVISTGTVTARSDLDMFGADGSLHILVARGSDHRVDMLAGYTYNKMKTSIGVESQSTNVFTGDAIVDGTVFTTNDLFETENVFNGAHLGVLSSVVRNKVSLTTLAKVAFGNMRQTGDIRGFTINNPPNAAAVATAGGVFAQPSNMGPFARDVFAFIPELGIKLGYRPRENVELTVGYTCMFWSSVGVAGDQMDRTIDLVQTVARPTASFVDRSFWMQGIDLGMNIRF